MKKVIFEGTINGKTFDNLADYNTEINRLAAEGIAFSASTNSRTIDTENPEPTKNNPGNIDLPQELIPGFEHCLVLHTDLDDDFLEKFKDTPVKEINKTLIDSINKALPGLSPEYLKAYVKSLPCVIEHLSQLKKEIDDNEAQIQKSIAELNEIRRDNLKYLAVVTTFLTTYNYVLGETSNRAKAQEQAAAEPAKTDAPESEKPSRNELRDLVDKLYDAFFGK